jgi:cystathionine beta-lyase/cystathionine gamma-synthase
VRDETERPDEDAPEPVRRGAATRAVHAGERQPPAPRRPVAVPIHQTAPFLFDNASELDRAFAAAADESTALYSRYGNPSVRVVEEKLAALEGAEDAVAFASGMAAVSGLLSTLLTSGDRLLATGEIYGGTHGWLSWLQRRHPEVAVDRVPVADLADRLEAGAPEATRVVYLETPSNPLLVCCDLARIAELCRRQGLTLVVDNTFATPVLQRPLELGAHLVVHSATKYLGGHSDVIAGLVAGDRGTLSAVRETLRVGGACLDPHAAYLVARGMRTLTLRVERQSANAAHLASFLQRHPRVGRVLYPGFDPVARRQMRAGGGMVAFELEVGEDRSAQAAAAAQVVDHLRLIRIIPSLGGVETGIMIPALTSHRQLSPEERAAAGISDGLLRLSCGIEDPEDLEEDLARALEGLPARGGETTP